MMDVRGEELSDEDKSATAVSGDSSSLITDKM
jgi:hypothetical protein